MRLAQQVPTGKWVVLYNDAPIAISGRTQFDSRENAIEQIAARGLRVEDNGDIVRPGVEPVQFQAPEPEPVQASAKLARNSKAIEELDSEPTPTRALQTDTTVEITLTDVDQKTVDLLSGKKIPEPTKGKRGRPRTYSPEEAAQRRREQNRQYYHARREARKAEVAERSKEWWEAHPEKVNEYRSKANEKRRSRYSDDPEYRAKVAAYNRAYQARKRQERATAKVAQEIEDARNEG